MRNEVLQNLADWISYVTSKKETATPEEIAALPRVAEVFLRNYSSALGAKKNGTTGTTTDSIVANLEELSKSDVRRSL